MEDTIRIVQEFYDSGAEEEWLRLERHPAEFAITVSYLERYVQPGERVLDLGGGPGRYSLWLAERGCRVTLCDLSEGNVRFAQAKAAERGLPLRALTGDARQADSLLEGPFDHVLLMGPLYHLLEEADRLRAVEASLNLLKPGGCLFAAFINSFAGLIYDLQDPARLLQEDPEYLRQMVEDRPFRGMAFTQAYFARPKEIDPFFARFPLEKLHLLGCESILSPFEHQFLAQPPDIRAAILDYAKHFCEREDLYNYSEHLMYIGRYKGGAPHDRAEF